MLVERKKIVGLRLFFLFVGRAVGRWAGPWGRGQGRGAVGRAVGRWAGPWAVGQGRGAVGRLPGIIGQIYPNSVFFRKKPEQIKQKKA